MENMNHSAIADRRRLQAIAHEVMIERGLLPDFSPAVLAETDAIATAALMRRRLMSNEWTWTSSPVSYIETRFRFQDSC